VVGGRLAHLGAAEAILELADLGVGLALLLARGVVSAVLAEVALLARGRDLLRDLGQYLVLEAVQLGDESVVGLLGHPDGLGLGRHGFLLYYVRHPGSTRGVSLESTSINRPNRSPRRR